MPTAMITMIIAIISIPPTPVGCFDIVPLSATVKYAAKVGSCSNL